MTGVAFPLVDPQEEVHMKPVLGRIVPAAGLVIVVLGLALVAPRARAGHDDDDRASVKFVYAAKVICTFDIETQINVHNPNPKSVTFIKKGIALDSGQVPTAPGPRTEEKLNADWALQMDCNDLNR